MVCGCCYPQRRKAFDFEGKLQVAARFESRYESERERSAELQARVRKHCRCVYACIVSACGDIDIILLQLLELSAQEAAWRTERLQLADLSAKLESARAEINQEREGNVDLRRKLASQRELEFDLRAEKDRRQAVEAKLAVAEKQATQAHDAATEIARLKHDKQMVCIDCTSGYLSCGPMAKCVVHALKGLARRACGTPASSPASHCKQCSALTSPSLHVRGCASPSRAR